MPLSLSSRDFYRSVESITRHMYSDLRVSGSQGGEPRKGEKKEESERERRKKIRTSGGERWPFQCKQLGEHRVRLAAIGQVNDATYAREWSQGARHSRPTTDDRRPTTSGGGRAFTTITENCDSARNSCFSTVSNGLSTATPRQLERTNRARARNTFFRSINLIFRVCETIRDNY